MTTLPSDIEAWADQEAELEQLFGEQREIDAESDAQPDPERAP